MINDRQISRLFLGVKVLLMAGLLYVGVGTVITPFSSGSGGPPQATSAKEHLATANGNGLEPTEPADYSLIVTNNLFGGSDHPQIQSSSVEGPKIDSSMLLGEEFGLKLTGTLAGGPRVSRAIIENTETQETNYYKIGDVVASATIESIGPDKVILIHNGQRRLLQMQSGSLGSVPSQSNLTVAPAIEPDVKIPRSSRFGYVEDLFRQATFEPYIENGQTKGLKITGLEKIPLAAAIGLKNGDVVQSVNGQELLSKQKAVQVLKKARTQSQMNMQLLRNGKSKELSFNL